MQLPDYHYAGTDIYIKYKRATINSFEPYFPLEAELHVINHPTNSVEERVVKNRFVVPPVGSNGRKCNLFFVDCPRDHFICSIAHTLSNRDGESSNIRAFQRYCHKWLGGGDYLDYQHDAPYLTADPSQDPPPAAYLNGKQETAGTLTKVGFFSLTIEVWRHITYVTFIAKHESGTKTFKVRINYRVEGNSRITTVPFQITLAPGEYHKKKLSVSGGDDWADVGSVDISQVKPLPDPPSDTGGSGLLDDAEVEVGIGVGPIEVSEPLKKLDNGQFANQDETSDSNQNEN